MREVRIRDTLSGEPRAIEADEEGVVGIYACGPTVYSRIHIGNARPFVVFSLLRRFLESEGYAARLVVNVTDVNDKIYVAARSAGVPSAEFAREMTQAYFADTDRLGLGRPDAEPLATETIEGIVALIYELVEGGHAYEAGGDVYFRVRSFDGYGKLSNRRTEEMDQGEEAGSASLKEDPLDFALWKASKEGEDTSWDSPWGRGRPAWHIECSVMAEEELGESFAVHGGGADLVFPHHENEIAQSEAAGRRFARLWMHNGMVETGAEKMSKSEGNIFQLSEALDRYGREAVVLFLISGHYRQPLAFGPEQMEQAVAQVERLRNFFRTHQLGAPGTSEVDPGARRELFLDALADDFNTPRALAQVFELVGDANREEVPGAAEAVRDMLGVLGLDSIAEVDAAADAAAEALLAEREEARAAKDFERADAIRAELAARGWEVRDSSAGATLVPLAARG
ncbi:MAG: cysteine--tRNA ligase [Actinobacteria bacterium]|nr:cysteine--tRNA ligase [Actinomycetota bacterium]